jgi:hypothetical protein
MKTVAWCYDAGLPLAALARLGGMVGAALREAGMRALTIVDARCPAV